MPKITPELRTWSGKFGRDYTDRNIVSVDDLYKKNYGITRTELNKTFLSGISRSSGILEIGSNIGNQLLTLQKMGFRNLHGIEPQSHAVELSRKRTKGIRITQGNVFDLPFDDGCFDLVFTSGVLIHINPADIKDALNEIYRASKKYIWGFEYYSDRYEDIVYRGRKGMLWKTNFSKLYRENFSGLRLIKEKSIKYLDKSGNIDSMFLLKKNGDR